MGTDGKLKALWNKKSFSIWKSMIFFTPWKVRGRKKYAGVTGTANLHRNNDIFMKISHPKKIRAVRRLIYRLDKIPFFTSLCYDFI